jgi:hypothetical protein
MEEVAKIKRGDDKPKQRVTQQQVGRTKPLLVEDEAALRPKAGSTFKLQEVPGDGSVWMGAEISAATRGTQVAMHPDLVARLKRVTHNTNWTTAMMALDDYAMNQLAGIRIIFKARDADKGKGPLVTYELEEASTTRIIMEGKMPVCGNEGRRRIAVPLDVRRRIERAIDATLPFGHAVMALAWWALDDLEERGVTLLVPKQEEPKKKKKKE